VGRSETQHSGIGVIDKAVSILEAVAIAPNSLAELVESTNLPRATAHRLAVALEIHGLLSRDSEGRFVVGSRIAELASALPDPLVTAAAPILAWVRDECGESSQLYRRDGRMRICIASAERAAGLRTTVPVGTQLPLSAGSGAQVLAAWLEDTALLDDILNEAAFTVKTLADVRRRGWAQSIGEREAGVASVSAPVFSPSGEVIAALSVSGPIERLGRTPGQRIAPILTSGARRITAALTL